MHEPQDHQRQAIVPQKRKNRDDIFNTDGKEASLGDLASTKAIATHFTSVDHASQAPRLDMPLMGEEDDRYMSSELIPQDTSMATSAAIHSDDSANKISCSSVAPKLLTSTPHNRQPTFPKTIRSDNTDMILLNQERLFELFGEFLKEAGLNSAEVCESSTG